MKLILRCPYCGNEHFDDWECLGPGEPEFLRCENAACSMSFVFLIRECSRCENESVFTWKEMPGTNALAGLLCQHCAEPLREATTETQDTNPSQ